MDRGKSHQRRQGPPRHSPPALAVALCFAIACVSATALAQGPQVDVVNPPGSPGTRGKLGESLGASGTSSFDGTPVTSQESLFGGRPGPSASRAPLNQITAPHPAVVSLRQGRPLAQLEEAAVSRLGDLDLPAGEPAEEGPLDGLTLDAAIDQLVARNLALLALRYEVPMAEADVLTAGLRANPIFYADAQLVPYGHYSNSRPGGSLQYDVNVTLPLDVWRKRKARSVVAQRARQVTEAQLQDAIRVQIVNLYTAYVDVVAAGLTVKFSEAYAAGLNKLLQLNEQLKGAGFIKASDVLALKARLQLAELQIREAKQNRVKTLRTLGLLLNLDAARSDALQLRGGLADFKPLPTTREALVETGLNARPDLNGYRMGLLRARADVSSARTQRFSDVYLLYQPYTFQNNAWQGLKSATSYALGVTVALPLYNRNQGNILRAELNAEQSQVELADQERRIVFDVEEAVREFTLSGDVVVEYRKEVIPASSEVRDSAFRRWQGGETSALDYLAAQQDFNDVVRQYRDALVRHRRSMLDLNTAVGVRVLP